MPTLFKKLLAWGISFTWRFNYGKKDKGKDLRPDAETGKGKGKTGEEITKDR